MNSERILAFSLSKQLNNDELESVSGAGMTCQGTGGGGYSRSGGFEGHIDTNLDAD